MSLLFQKPAGDTSPTLTKPIPLGSRSGLSDPKAVSTPLPASKVTGDPVDTLVASKKPQFPNVISPFEQPNPRPLGFFELTYRNAGDPPTRISDTDRRQQRNAVEQASRQLRAREGKWALLDTSKPTPIDFAKRVRVNSAGPAGRSDMIAETRSPALRGVTAQALTVPAKVLDSLASEGMAGAATGDLPAATGAATDTLVPTTPAPIGRPSMVATSAATPLTTSSAAMPDQTLYLLVAAGVAFFLLRGLR